MNVTILVSSLVGLSFLSFFPIINIIIILLYRGRIFFIFISSSFFRATHHKQADHGINILES